MFTRLTLRTREAGLMVIYRLPDNSGGLGDVIATSEGVLVSGQFDLRDNVAMETFQAMLQKAQSMAVRLQAGLKPEDEEEHDREDEDNDELSHQHSVVARHLKSGEPLHIGHRSVHTKNRFSTVTMKVTDAGGLEPHCALCLAEIKADDQGWFALQKDVRSIGLHENPEQDTVLSASLKVMPSLVPWGKAIKEHANEEGLWVHDCSSVEKASCLLGFKIPNIMRREDVVEE